MANKFFEELSRCLRKKEIESANYEDKRLEVFLHGQPVLFVSPANDVFLLPAGSKNEEASELYHQVAVAADEVYSYVEAMQNAPLLHASGLHEDFRLLADFGGAVLAGQERENGQGYQFVTWIWDYDRTGVSHGHYYEDNFQSAKQDFAVRSGLTPERSYLPRRNSQNCTAPRSIGSMKARSWTTSSKKPSRRPEQRSSTPSRISRAGWSRSRVRNHK